MSILIKGMNMPEAGQVIEIAQNADGNMFARLEPSFDSWHEVVTVPTPHGRLIDASAKIEVQLYDEMTEEWSLKTMTVDDYLAFAADLPTTIIEAEEGEGE